MKRYMYPYWKGQSRCDGSKQDLRVRVSQAYPEVGRSFRKNNQSLFGDT